jgi:probable phosphoglycerate mutase
MASAQPLKNRYFMMRHGHSLANEAGIVVSDPKNGVPGYGLSEKGKRQVEESIKYAKEIYGFDQSLLIVSSDFKRCRETAEAVSAALGTSNVELEPRLRERFFGEFELGPNTTYAQVWTQDAINDQIGSFGTESAQATLNRGLAVIADLETQFTGETILLVSHGDTLQILSTAFDLINPGRHRDLPLLETAEIRPLCVD